MVDLTLPAFEHYRLNTAPTDEFADRPETQPSIRNIGWTLGNDCPYRCTHCYSMNARVKGRNMNMAMVDRIVEQLRINGIETVNLGGNEPLFTNGSNPKDTLLPCIIRKLSASGIDVGLTTSGVSLLYLRKYHAEEFGLLNDVDVSLDSPFEELHNQNRGAPIYHQAIEALEHCRTSGIPHTIIMCGMNWNFNLESIERLVELAVELGANVRINPIKPTLPEHKKVALEPAMYYEGFSRLLNLCDPIDLGEPPIAAVTQFSGAGRCPCGRTSFRIHSVTPEGQIHVSPCVYLHDYKAPLDLLEHDLVDIINSPQFRAFRQRHANPEAIRGCAGCELLSSCGGGCAGRAFLHNWHTRGQKTLLAKDPYCPRDHATDFTFPKNIRLNMEQRLVHMDYLCTWIGRPRKRASEGATSASMIARYQR